MSIPIVLKDLLEKLEFISMIQKDQKPCINSMTFVDSRSWSGSIKRCINSENQNILIAFLEKQIELSSTNLDEYSGTIFHPILVSALSRAKDGIILLLHTYRNNPKTLASLRVCLNNIELQLHRK